jgi:hypothetical protein
MFNHQALMKNVEDMHGAIRNLHGSNANAVTPEDDIEDFQRGGIYYSLYAQSPQPRVGLPPTGKKSAGKCNYTHYCFACV